MGSDGPPDGGPIDECTGRGRTTAARAGVATRPGSAAGAAGPGGAACRRSAPAGPGATRRPSSGAGSTYCVAASQPEVQPAGRLPTVAPGRDRVAGPPRRPSQPAVRRQQPVGVLDDDVAGAGHDAAERHHAGGRGPHRRAGRDVVLQARGCRGTTGTAAGGTGRPTGASTGGSRQRRGDGAAARAATTRRDGTRVAAPPGSGCGPRVAGSARRRRRRGEPAGGARTCVWICGTRLSLTPSTRLIWPASGPRRSRATARASPARAACRSRPASGRAPPAPRPRSRARSAPRR